MKNNNKLYLNDCGIKSIKFILDIYTDNKIPKHVIIDEVNLTEQGISVYSLVKYLIKFFPLTNAYKANHIDSLNNMPSILLLQKQDDNIGHFIVLTKITKKSVTVFDPNAGMVKISKKKLSNIWKGIFIDFGQSLPSINNYINKEIKINKIPLIILEMIESGFLIIILSSIINIISLFSVINLITLLLSLILYFIVIKIKVSVFNILMRKLDSEIDEYYIRPLFRLPASYLKLLSQIEYHNLFSDLFKYRKIIIEEKNPITILLITILVHLLITLQNLEWGVLFIIVNLINVTLSLIISHCLKRINNDLNNYQNNLNNLILKRTSNKTGSYEEFMESLRNLHYAEENIRFRNTVTDSIIKLISFITYIIIIFLGRDSNILLLVTANQILNYLWGELVLYLINHKETEAVKRRVEELRNF